MIVEKNIVCCTWINGLYLDLMNIKYPTIGPGLLHVLDKAACRVEGFQHFFAFLQTNNLFFTCRTAGWHTVQKSSFMPVVVLEYQYLKLFGIDTIMEYLAPGRCQKSLLIVWRTFNIMVVHCVKYIIFRL